VLRLRQALYRLRQAPRAWNTKLDASLVSLGFTKCAIEHALYAQRSQGGLVIVRVCGRSDRHRRAGRRHRGVQAGDEAVVSHERPWPAHLLPGYRGGVEQRGNHIAPKLLREEAPRAERSEQLQAVSDAHGREAQALKGEHDGEGACDAVL